MSKNGTQTGPAVAVAQSAWRREGALSHISGWRGCGKCGKCGGKGYAAIWFSEGRGTPRVQTDPHNQRIRRKYAELSRPVRNCPGTIPIGPRYARVLVYQLVYGQF